MTGRVQRPRGNRWSGWRRWGVVVLALLLLCSGTTSAMALSTPVASSAAEVQGEPLAAAVVWLTGQQTEDGGFLGFDGAPDAGATTDAVLALRAAELAGTGSGSSIDRAALWLNTNGGQYAATGPGQAAKTALAAIAAGQDPTDFAGLDLIALMQEPAEAGTPVSLAAAYGDDLYDHALVILALVAAGVAAPESAIGVLRQTVNDAGGWAYDGANAPGGADSNTTALVIQALAAAGLGGDPLVTDGLAALREFQTTDGGFAYQLGDPLTADANSTALAVQAILSAGGNPASPDWNNAVAALAAFAARDGGFRYLAGDDASNLFATVQAIPALAGAPLPIACLAPANATPPADAMSTAIAVLREDGPLGEASLQGADTVRIVYRSVCPPAPVATG